MTRIFGPTVTLWNSQRGDNRLRMFVGRRPDVLAATPQHIEKIIARWNRDALELLRHAKERIA